MGNILHSFWFHERYEPINFPGHFINPIDMSQVGL